MLNISKYIVVLCCLFSLSCSSKPEGKDNNPDSDEQRDYFLVHTDPSNTSLYFTNKVLETEEHHYLAYESMYNGSGVAIGDINNDGLSDIYLGGNSVFDKLYLNKGDLKFKDISKSSGISGIHDGWTTGINMVDINADGLLDIYVCRGGPYKDSKDRSNKLFINNGDLTFTESAAGYGLDIDSYSIQTAFLDYDLDGDLDVYLMNQPPPSFQFEDIRYRKLSEDIQSGKRQTDKFFENMDGKFVEKTAETGLTNFGYRLGIAVGDINQDSYPDLYVCSDYDGADLMYINTRNKRFKNTIHEQIGHISLSSMGTDMADINNDGWLDILVLEMAPDDHFRAKYEMLPMNRFRFQGLAKNGFHNQYMYNTLQLNNGNGSFSEIADLAGLAKSDWSWGPLFLDIDNDGRKDLFIANGVKHQFIFGDLAGLMQEKSEEYGRPLNISEINELSLTNITPNVIYRYEGGLKYKKITDQWMDKSAFNSNGVAYGDLDNDGDFDLVANNMDDNVSLYESRSANGPGGNYIKFILRGPEKNRFAIGSKIKIKKDEEILYQELHNARGYLSSMEYSLVFGLGDMDTLRNVEIIWPDGQSTYFSDLDVNKTYHFTYDEAVKSTPPTPEAIVTIFQEMDPQELGITYGHKENRFNDYKNQILLPWSQSHNGPYITEADVNDDGLQDFFVGGAANQSGELYIQNHSGKFSRHDGPWNSDTLYEDLGCVFFDYDNDGDQDLYVVSGGSEFPAGSDMFQDRLYSNNGDGHFSKTTTALPTINTSGQIVKTHDFDGDGDLDIFIGGRILPDRYPFPPTSHLLLNEKGRFVDVTSKNSPDLERIGMVTDAIFVDIDQDNDEDLLIVGEWAPIQILENNNGLFRKIEVAGLENSVGLWFSVTANDIDNDGDMDFFAGNLGLNSKFKTGNGHSFHIYCDDFDQSGTYDIVLSYLYKDKLVPVKGREYSSQQMPFIAEKFPTIESFAAASLEEIYGREELDHALHYEADLLESVFVENRGNGRFEIKALPVEAQISPIHDFDFLDINGNGADEVFMVGNLYHTEVETMRLDASYGCILEYRNGGFVAVNSRLSGFSSRGDARDICLIETGNDQHLLMVANNNEPLNIFRFINK